MTVDALDGVELYRFSVHDEIYLTFDTRPYSATTVHGGNSFPNWEEF
jgi:hypothetical protein